MHRIPDTRSHGFAWGVWIIWAAAVLMISSELEEVLEGSDRVFVLREGRSVAEFSHADATESAVMTAMAHGDSDLVPEGSAS